MSETRGIGDNSEPALVVAKDQLRAIIERIREYGVPIDRVVCAGGIAEKNPLLMQIYADVTGCTMHVAGSSQACALGAAVSAAVLAGAHPDFPTAQAKMTSLKKR